jgi:hypothetical protein
MTLRRQSNSEYYQEYYRKNKDIYKYRYYLKKEQDEEREAMYEKYGGEEKYYKMMYKQYAIMNKNLSNNNVNAEKEKCCSS